MSGTKITGKAFAVVCSDSCELDEGMNAKDTIFWTSI